MFCSPNTKNFILFTSNKMNYLSNTMLENLMMEVLYFQTCMYGIQFLFQLYFLDRGQPHFLGHAFGYQLCQSNWDSVSRKSARSLRAVSPPPTSPPICETINWNWEGEAVPTKRLTIFRSLPIPISQFRMLLPGSFRILSNSSWK